MRRTTTVVVILAAALVGTQAHAGVYLPAEEPYLVPVEDGQARPMPFEQFRTLVYPEIRSLGLAIPGRKESEQREQYKLKRDALLKKGRDRLTPDELISLSGYQIRLRELTEAEATLAPATRQPGLRDRFEVYANLAIVHFQTGRTDEAFQNQTLALSLLRSAQLPASLPRNWLIKAEREEKSLFQLRRAEPAASGAAGRPSDQLDRLLPESAFADSAQRAEAIALVQQLLFWLPDDTRLYWLLGELYRAGGDWEAAARIYDECIDARGFGPPLLKEHRHEVKAKLAELTPKTPTPAEQVPTGAAPESSSGWRPTSGRLFVVGAAAGLFVLALAYFQWRELRRRLRPRPPRAAG